MSCYNRTCIAPSLSGFSNTLTGLNLTHAQRYQVRVRAVAINQEVTDVTTTGFLTDLTPPTAGSVYDGISSYAYATASNISDAPTGNSTASYFAGSSSCLVCRPEQSFQAQNTSLSVSWTLFADQESGLSQYCWTVGSYPGGSDVASALCYDTTVATATRNISLQQGHTYYSTVTAFNGANLTSANTSTGVLVDITPPVMQNVRDGLDDDLDFTSLTDVLFNNYYCVDPESGLSAYEVTTVSNAAYLAITDSKQADAAGLQFTSAGLSTLWAQWGLSLTKDVKYYAGVRCTNQAGLGSRVLWSNGITVGQSQVVASANTTNRMMLDMQSRAELDDNGQLLPNSTAKKPSNPSGTYGTVAMPPGAVDSSQSFVAGGTNIAKEDPRLNQSFPTNNLVFGNYSFQMKAVDDSNTIIEGFHFKAPIYITLYYNVQGLANAYSGGGGQLNHSAAQSGDDSVGGDTVPALMLWSVTDNKWEDAADTCTPPNVTIDRVAFSYTVALCHLTEFAMAIQIAPVSRFQPLLSAAAQAMIDAAQWALPTNFFTNRTSVDWTSLVIKDGVVNAPVFLLPSSVNGTSGLSIGLDGSQSYDPDGNITGYAWTYTYSSLLNASSSPATNDGRFNSTSIRAPTFHATKFGLYSVTLTVQDANHAATAINRTLLFDHAPVVVLESSDVLVDNTDATADNVTVTLNASASFDWDEPQGDHLSYQWSLYSAASQVTLTYDGANSSTVNISGFPYGAQYQFKVTVTDAFGVASTGVASVQFRRGFGEVPKGAVLYDESARLASILVPVLVGLPLLCLVMALLGRRWWLARKRRSGLQGVDVYMPSLAAQSSKDKQAQRAKRDSAFSIKKEGTLAAPMAAAAGPSVDSGGGATAGREEEEDKSQEAEQNQAGDTSPLPGAMQREEAGKEDATAGSEEEKGSEDHEQDQRAADLPQQSAEAQVTPSEQQDVLDTAVQSGASSGGPGEDTGDTTLEEHKEQEQDRHELDDHPQQQHRMQQPEDEAQPQQLDGVEVKADTPGAGEECTQQQSREATATTTSAAQQQSAPDAEQAQHAVVTTPASTEEQQPQADVPTLIEAEEKQQQQAGEGVADDDEGGQRRLEGGLNEAERVALREYATRGKQEVEEEKTREEEEQERSGTPVQAEAEGEAEERAEGVQEEGEGQ